MGKLHKKLFEDTRGDKLNISSTEGPQILKSEIEYALQNMKDGKTSGEDNIFVEYLKYMGENGQETLYKLFNQIYDTGIIPEDWLKSTFITIPKNNNAKTCSEHRTISLMSQTLKVFLKILHNRIYNKSRSYISKHQFGFRKGIGTREALFCPSNLAERCIEMGIDFILASLTTQKHLTKFNTKNL